MTFLPLAEIARARPGMKECIGLFAGILVVIVLGYALLFAVSALPRENLRKNILQADARGFFSDNYPQYDWLRPLYNRLDMFTECVGIGVALNMRPDAKTLLEMPMFGECSALRKVITGDTPDAAPYLYMRFIHGYQIALKSMYTFFSLETVRAAAAGISLLLLVLLFIALQRATDTRYAAVVVFSFFLTSSPNMFFTVTHATQFWLVTAAGAAAALGRGRICPLCFFGFVGAMDAFCHYFLAQSLSLALPLLCYTLARWADGESPGSIAAEAFWGCIGWSFGFVLPWLIKWSVLFLVLAPTKAELFGVTLENYPARGLTMILTAVQRNFLSANWPTILFVIAFCVLRRRRMALEMPPGLWMACLPGLLPFVWMCILPGHSGVRHSTFVNLILWPFLATCLLLLLAMPIDSRKHLLSRRENTE